MNKNLFIAICLFLSWTFSFSLGNLIVVLLVIVKTNWRIPRENLSYLIIVLSILCLINIFLGLSSDKLINDGSSRLQLFIPYLSLLLGSYLIGSHLNSHVIKYIIYLTAIECVVILIQYSLGETGFWYNSYIKNETNGDLLYYSRPNGFSTNSSVVAQKLLVSIWFLILSKTFTYKQNKFIFILLIFGLILTFNRTVFLALFLSYFLFSRGIRLKYKIISGFLVLAFFALFFSSIKSQFLRGSDEVQLESFSRYTIFQNGLNYISENPYFGNNSIKYFYEENDRKFHLHNSYLEAAASNGIPIFLLLMYMIVRLLKRRNVFVPPLLVYSLFQFGILWGISFLDIALFYNEENDKKDYISNS